MWCGLVFSTVAAVSLFQGQLLVEVVVTVAAVSLLAVFGLLFLVKVSCWWRYSRWGLVVGMISPG